MDLRFRVATSYLWIEEAILGEEQVQIEKAWTDLREAKKLSEILLNGGEHEHGFIVQPLKEPVLRRRAENIRRLVSEFGMLSRERHQRPEAGGIGSVLEERHDRVFNELQRIGEDLETLVEKDYARDYANSRRLFLAILLAWSSIVVASTTALSLLERRRRHAEEALQRAKDELEIRVGERTSELRSLNHELSVELTERKKTESALRESEGQLRHLSVRLLTAQETERGRIATELHDELGHSLVLMQLRLGLIEKGLGGLQTEAKADCNFLSQFIDQVIEDVRRLSRDLRPSVLENAGLSAALQCLAGNSIRSDQTKVVSSITDVDHLFSPTAELVLYRIIQEAFTNIGKHAQAKHVTLSVARQGDGLAVVLEDDGKGFDVKAAITRDASERGFGLATLHERARMLGGSLSVWSEEGKGTRISLGVPVGNGGGS
jgi:signal transduction histidine kinase